MFYLFWFVWIIIIKSYEIIFLDILTGREVCPKYNGTSVPINLLEFKFCLFLYWVLNYIKLLLKKISSTVNSDQWLRRCTVRCTLSTTGCSPRPPPSPPSTANSPSLLNSAPTPGERRAPPQRVMYRSAVYIVVPLRTYVCVSYLLLSPLWS